MKEQVETEGMQAATWYMWSWSEGMYGSMEALGRRYGEGHMLGNSVENTKCVKRDS